MRRSDALIGVLTSVLDQNRTLLDGPAKLRSVRMEVKFVAGQELRALTFSPEIESVRENGNGKRLSR